VRGPFPSRYTTFPARASEIPSLFLKVLPTEHLPELLSWFRMAMPLPETLAFAAQKTRGCLRKSLRVRKAG